MKLERLVSLAGLALASVSQAHRVEVSTSERPLSHYPQLIREMHLSPPPAHIQQLFDQSETRSVRKTLLVDLFESEPEYMSEINTVLDSVHTQLSKHIDVPTYTAVSKAHTDSFPHTDEKNNGLLYLVEKRENQYTFILDGEDIFNVHKTLAGEVTREVYVENDRFSYRLTQPIIITPGKFDAVDSQIRVTNTAIAEYLHKVVAQSTVDRLTESVNSHETPVTQIKQKYLELLQEEENLVHAVSLGMIANRFGEQAAKTLLAHKYEQMNGWDVTSLFESFPSYELDTVCQPLIKYMSRE